MSNTAERSLVLYYAPGACSLAAHIVLREAGLPFELKRVDLARGEQQSPDYLALNPRGRVPLLIVDGQPISELSAILMWLGQQCGLCPPPGSTELARCGEWLAWLTSSVHIAYALLWRGERFTPEPALHGELARHAMTLLRAQYGEIESRLGEPYALGRHYSVVDANLVVFYRWGVRIGLDMRADFPRWSALNDRLLAREAVAAAFAAEGVTPRATAPSAGSSTTAAGIHDMLGAFGDAWARGDVDALVAMMDEDGVYRASAGPGPGATYRGSRQLRAGIAAMLVHDRDGVRAAGPSWIIGDMAFAKWSFRFVEDGTETTVEGIDHFEFKHGKVSLKDAYRKVLSTS